MANGIRNWSYRDITRFLKDHNFYLSHQLGGSHEAWVRIENDKEFVVNVNKTKSSYPPLTMKTMISQSGIDEKEWRKWGSS